MPVDKSIQGCDAPGKSARAVSTFPPWARNTSNGAGTAFTMSFPLEVKLCSGVRCAAKLPVVENGLVLLIQKVLHPRLQLDGLRHLPRESHIDEVVAGDAARIRSVVEALARVRERCAHLQAEREAI